MEDYLDEESHLFMWKTTLCSSWYTLQNNGRHGRSERQLAMDGTLMVILLCLTLYYRVFYIIYNLHVFIYMRCIYLLITPFFFYQTGVYIFCPFSPIRVWRISHRQCMVFNCSPLFRPVSMHFD